MRFRGLAITILALSMASCDSGPADNPIPDPPPTTKASTKPSVAQQIQELTGVGPTTTTVPITPTTIPATTQSFDPLAKPENATLRLLALISKRDMDAVRMVIFDPPPPEQLDPAINVVADRMTKGAKFQIVETIPTPTCSVVIYKTWYGSRFEVTGLVFIKRYDRWKAVLGELNMNRLTENEKIDMSTATQLAEKRVEVLLKQAQATTKKSEPGKRS